MGWFSKKPPWEDIHAERIYEALAVSDDLGDMTPERLRVPPAAMQRYFEKALLQRELMCFVALMSSAGPETNLRPVMMAFSKLLSQKIAARGIGVDIDHLAEASMEDVRKMLTEPFAWSQNWLAEFRNAPRRQLHGGDVRGPLPPSIQCF